MTQLCRNPIQCRCNHRQRAGVMGMAITSDYLRRYRRNVQSKPFTYLDLKIGIKVSAIAHRTRKFSYAHLLCRPFETLNITRYFIVESRQFQAECDGFGVNAMRPPDLWRVAEFERSATQHILQLH